MAFALYGKTPAVESATKSLIHQLCTEYHVELRFEVDGQVWRAVRSLRRKGQSGHQLELLDVDEPDAAAEVVVTGDDPMKARIEQLLGMDFKAFCRSVLLAQNRFSEFLRASRVERDGVLKGVFGYERLDEAQAASKFRLREVELQLEALGKDRRAIDEARAQLDDARAAAGGAARRLQELEGAAPEFERLTKERDAASAQAEEAVAHVAALVELLEGMPTAAEVDEVVARGEGAAEAVALAHAAPTRRPTPLASGPTPHTPTSWRGSATGCVSARSRSCWTRSTASGLRRSGPRKRSRPRVGIWMRRTSTGRVWRTKPAQAAGGLVEAEAARAAAADAVSVARGVLLEAQHADMARELRGTLASGEPCPVCAQPVHTIPRAGRASTVAAADRALAKAGRLEEKAEAERTRRAAADASARTAAEGAVSATKASERAVSKTEASHREAEAAVAATGSQLIEWLGGEDDPRASFRARESELAAAEEARDRAIAAAEAARRQLEDAKDADVAAGAALARIADRLSGSWGRLDEDREIAPTADGVRASFLELGETVIAYHEQAGIRRDEAQERAAGAADALHRLLGELGLDPGATFSDAVKAAAIEHGTASQVVKGLEERIARAGALEAELLAAEGRRDLAFRLAEDLKPSRFLNYLLSEQREELSELGSEHFERLTDGTYRFTDDGLFGVVDINAAGAERKVDSLSGGETFLASLALALGLAEMVAREGGRLDAFFLDEGFGSLDPEHLDRAMDGIGRLVAEDARRLVVVVSHVAEMREAVEDLIVLDKDALTGDTRVLSGASPAPVGAGPA